MTKKSSTDKDEFALVGSEFVSDAGTTLIVVHISKLVYAGWNYKTDGTEEQIEKLCKSIKKDKSAGILAVREIEIDGQKKYEVIDGNHRLKAVGRIGWVMIPCENFGVISLAEAVTISRRRNESWFETDLTKLAELYRDVVIPEIPLNELVQFMPETEQDFKDLDKLLDFDWNKFGDPNATGNVHGESGETKEEIFHELKLNLPNDTYRLWQQWIDRLTVDEGYLSPEKAFELAIADALSTPEESHE